MFMAGPRRLALASVRRQSARFYWSADVFIEKSWRGYLRSPKHCSDEDAVFKIEVGWVP